MSDLTIALDGFHLLQARYAVRARRGHGLEAPSRTLRRRSGGLSSRRRQQGFTAWRSACCLSCTTAPYGREPSSRSASSTTGSTTSPCRTRSTSPRVGRFTELALAHDLRPLLVLLWCNYVPGTWGAERTPWGVMGAADRRRYWEAVRNACQGHQPIFALSGDDRFDSPAANDAYREMMGWVSTEAPDCLVTAHSAPTAQLPEDIADSPDFDFFVYQSGHDIDAQERCYELAARYRQRAVPKPVINLEPAYERHGYGGGAGRYTAADVRKAVWWSITGGASAGWATAPTGLAVAS